MFPSEPLQLMLPLSVVPKDWLQLLVNTASIITTTPIVSV